MRILAVVVRYKTPLADSETLRALAAAFSVRPELLQQVSVLVWDNSPAPIENPQLPFPFEYRHSGENLGVSGAYNRALELAEGLRCPWMLLLDQDTTMPRHFLSRMLELSLQLDGRSEIAAIAPFLVDGEKTISPAILQFYRVKLLRPPFEGVHPGRMFAANSGTLMRVEALRQIGGFDETFWLDCSDIVAFHLLYNQNKVLYVAGDLRLPHRVTLNDYEGSMSPQRYRNFVSAEGAYWDLYRRPADNLIQTARLLARAVRQSYRFSNKAYARITLTHFLSRIFRSRKARLQAWRRQSQQRAFPRVAEGQIVD
ncbi:MAG TPA: glycosyltransferase [Acidobacteriaceae bacterium]|nr:glycosyltransferase [Acidobacteriaceae bacterium]